MTLDGGVMTLSWPKHYSDYVLQSQTDLFGEGLSLTNWYLVPGVTNQRLVVPIEHDKNSVFFRLLKP